MLINWLAVLLLLAMLASALLHESGVTIEIKIGEG